ncbi:ABC transporter ATP-binding protein [Intrasporangium oryzae NRRL B-24470]|uniref:ABC transporter ATP-binding protein n=1 Tax=Intrasporangium oryzae NRRL B-24470 TaxID=1386089 RepID=W9G957_9MICO|nr:ABC transporter ATP-binding protein [Intrasporangium oryzae]EWT02726.1 ABC transporter ATP-binding protein [Intrasporangium oryzae NRRL B-24470]
MTLHLDSVTLTYPDGDRRLTALDRVTLVAQPGSLTAVVGPSGSGKSSLLAVAATLIRPDSGRVLLEGRDLAALDDRDRTTARRDEIGIVFQSSNLLASLTALDQLLVIAHLAGTPLDAARQRARDLLDAVGLAGQADRRPHQLSGGQRQRVTIARGLMNEPSLLLVDEPTSSLDTERGLAVLDLIRRLTTERGLTTVMVTHQRDHLVAADHVVEIVDGRLAGGMTSPSPYAAGAGDPATLTPARGRDAS